MTETYSEGRDDRVGGGDAGAAHTAGRRVGREAHDADGTRVVLTLERAEDTCGRDADLDDGGEGDGEEGGETHGERAGGIGSSLVSRASGCALQEAGKVTYVLGRLVSVELSEGAAAAAVLGLTPLAFIASSGGMRTSSEPYRPGVCSCRWSGPR